MFFVIVKDIITLMNKQGFTILDSFWNKEWNWKLNFLKGLNFSPEIDSILKEECKRNTLVTLFSSSYP